MNSGVMKFNQIIGKCVFFSGSITIVQQDIDAMVATASAKRKLEPADNIDSPLNSPNATALHSKNSALPSPATTSLLTELHIKLEIKRN